MPCCLPCCPSVGSHPLVHILYATALLMFPTVAAFKVSRSQLSTSTASRQSPALCCGFPVPYTSSCFVWSQQRAFASCVPDQPPFLPRGGLLGALIRAWHLGATGCLPAKTVNLRFLPALPERGTRLERAASIGKAGRAEEACFPDGCENGLRHNFGPALQNSHPPPNVRDCVRKVPRPGKAFKRLPPSGKTVP